MCCPRCRQHFNVLAFHVFEQIEEFREETTPVYKCPKTHGGCGWIFAPAERAILGAMMRSERSERP